MKHYELMGLISIILGVRALPKWLCLIFALVTALFSVYLSEHGN